MLLGADGYNDADAPNNRILPEKIIGETGLLLLVASMLGANNEIAGQLEDVVAVLLPYARAKKTFLDICLQPPLAMEYAMAHIFLTRLGYPDARFDKLLVKTLDASARSGRERPPHREMEQVWMRNIWTGESTYNKREFVRMMNDSVLNKPVDLFYGTTADMYAFTHALMYATNFNQSPLKLPRSRASILSEAEAMLARCLDDEDYDLGGEVLLSWPLTGNSWSSAATFAFRVLARAEDHAGMLPAPGVSKGKIKKLEGVIREKYIYATGYHTAYVMGLLCAVSLQPGKSPPKNIHSKHSVRGSAQRFLGYLDRDPQKKQWRNEFDKLKPAEKDALAGFLLNVAFISSVRQKQYSIVYELLGIAYEMGMADTALASQAAELLDRLSLLA
jgi:hypothetical protein